MEVILKRRNDGSFEFLPKSVSGDVGDACKCGEGRKIEWAMLKDIPEGLDGNDYFFALRVTPAGAGSSFFWWVVGGTAVAGTAAAILLKSKPASAEEGLPKPIGRP